MRQTKVKSRQSSPRGVFITATDTGVGKTLVAAALVAHLRQRGIDIGVMKPVETGITRATKAQSDGVRLQQAAGSNDLMAEVCPYVFRLPLAPLSAAQEEGQTIRIATILQAFRTLRRKHDLLVVEGAGGLHVPITETVDGLYLLERMGLPVIVVGSSGLGGINHALLTLAALRQRKIPVVALVLNRLKPVRRARERAQEESTVTLLRRLAKVPVVGPLPYSASVTKHWQDGMIQLAWAAEIMTLAKLVSAYGKEKS